MNCPKCGGSRVEQEGPGPGQGGLYRLRCPDCGYEEAGICDPALPGDSGTEAPLPQVRAARESPERARAAIIGGCSVCGRPGRVQNLPGSVPASDCFCEEHMPSFTLKPLPILLALAGSLVLLWLLW